MNSCDSEVSKLFTAHLSRTPRVGVFLFLGVACGVLSVLFLGLIFPGFENTSPVAWISLTLLFIGFGLAVFGSLYLLLGFLFRRVYTVKVTRQHFSQEQTDRCGSGRVCCKNTGGVEGKDCATSTECCRARPPQDTQHNRK